MSKRRVDVRLEEELLSWADGYAEERRWTRTAVFEAALEALRGDAEGGVPDPPKPRGVTQAVERATGARVAPASDPRWAHQQRLNAAKYGKGQK